MLATAALAVAAASLFAATAWASSAPVSPQRLAIDLPAALSTPARRKTSMLRPQASRSPSSAVTFTISAARAYPSTAERPAAATLLSAMNFAKGPRTSRNAPSTGTTSLPIVTPRLEMSEVKAPHWKLKVFWVFCQSDMKVAGWDRVPTLFVNWVRSPGFCKMARAVDSERPPPKIFATRASLSVGERPEIAALNIVMAPAIPLGCASSAAMADGRTPRAAS